MEAGGDRHWPSSVWRLLCHWPRPRPGRVMGDGLTTVSAVYIHPNTAAVVLFTLGEAVSSLQTILNIKTELTKYSLLQPIVTCIDRPDRSIPGLTTRS